MMTETAEILDTGTSAGNSPERLGFRGLLWNVIIDPRKAFSNVDSGPLWLVLWLVFSAVYVCANYPVRSILSNEAVSQMERSLSSNDQMTPEQKEEMIEGTRRWTQSWLAWTVDCVSHLAILFVISAALLFIANIILGGNGTFMRMVNAYSLLFVISAIGVVVNAVLIHMKGSADVQLGLGILSSDGTSPFVKAILAAFSVFSIWQLWLSAEVVSVIGEVSLRRSLSAVAVVWVILVLMMGGLAAFIAGMAP